MFRILLRFVSYLINRRNNKHNDVEFEGVALNETNGEAMSEIDKGGKTFSIVSMRPMQRGEWLRDVQWHFKWTQSLLLLLQSPDDGDSLLGFKKSWAHASRRRRRRCEGRKEGRKLRNRRRKWSSVAPPSRCARWSRTLLGLSNWGHFHTRSPPGGRFKNNCGCFSVL